MNLNHSGKNLENLKSAKKHKQELIDFIIELEHHLLDS